MPAVGAVRRVRRVAAGAAGGYLDDLGPRLATRLLERGLLLRPLGNVLYLLPPYVIEDAEAEAAFDAIAAVLDEI